jgi:DNA-binding beta-propeller fold protein YncE
MTISPDGTTSYVSEYYGEALAFLDLKLNAILATVPVGGTAFSSAVSPDGSEVWQSILNSNAVSVISTVTQSISTNLPVSGGVYILLIGNATPTAQSITNL